MDPQRFTPAFAESRLAIWAPPDISRKIQWLGEELEFAPDETLFDSGSKVEFLYVILKGEVVLKDSHGTQVLLAGDIVNEAGFILGLAKKYSACAGDRGCRAWRISRNLFSHRHKNISDIILLTHIIMAIAPCIYMRKLKLKSPFEINKEVKKKEVKYCDFDHPSIKCFAETLRGEDDWATAENVWTYVRNLPFRFGFWNMNASGVLRLGFGMASTKANLQVALLRALGLEACFGAAPLPSRFIKALLPMRCRDALPNTDIQHYFALVKLDNKWEFSDASFTLDAAQLIAREHPEATPYVNLRFSRDRTLKISMLEDNYEILPDLDAVIEKKPFYNEDAAETMNILLDKWQGNIGILPYWVPVIKSVIKKDPLQAFHMAYAGICADVSALETLVAKKSISGFFKHLF